MPHPDHPVPIESLAPNDGGGYLATVPDVPSCMPDGGMRELAARNVGDTIAARIEVVQARGRTVTALVAAPRCDPGLTRGSGQ